MDGSRRIVRCGARGSYCDVQQNQGFQFAVQERQRRARRAVNEAVLESSVRLKPQMMFELRTAQSDNEQHMALREREIVTRLGHEVQVAFRHKRDHMLTLHQPLVREEDAQREFWQQYMASEQSLQKRQFEKASLDGGRVRDETVYHREMNGTSLHLNN